MSKQTHLPKGKQTVNDADREIIDHFTRTREKSIELAQRVPEELLGRTAEGEDFHLGWVFAHIANGVDWWMHGVMCDGQGPVPDYGHDKDSVAQALCASRDRLVSFFSADDGQAMSRTFSRAEEDGSTSEWTGRNRVLYLTSHEVHHRGKIVLALRQWGFSDVPFLPF